MTKAIIVDVETNGIIEPEIIEYGQMVVEIDEYGLIQDDVFVSKHSAVKPIDPAASAVHGMIDEDVAGFLPYLKVKPEVDYLIGHSVDFDATAMDCMDMKRICTLAMARDIWPEASSHKLMSLIFMLNPKQGKEYFQTAHSVRTDILGCAFLLDHILKKKEITSFEDLYAYSEEARIPKLMTFGAHLGKRPQDVPESYKDWYCKLPDADKYLVKAMGR